MEKMAREFSRVNGGLRKPRRARISRMRLRDDAGVGRGSAEANDFARSRAFFARSASTPVRSAMMLRRSREL